MHRGFVVLLFILVVTVAGTTAAQEGTALVPSD